MQGSFNSAFDECVRRLGEGASVEDCLGQFPQHAEELEQLLFAYADAGGQSVMPLTARARITRRVMGEWDRLHPSPGRWRWLWSAVPRAVAAAVLVIVIIALGGTGVALAAEDAIPGQRLYPVKEFQEHARLWLATSSEDKVSIFTQLVRDRASEIRVLGESGSINNALIAVGRLEDHIRNIDLLVKADPEIQQSSVEQYDAQLAQALEESVVEQEGVEATLQSVLDSAPEDAYPCTQNSLARMRMGREMARNAVEAVGGQLHESRSPALLDGGLCAQ
ncbi:MAG: DUF5667 domain-containing protein [Chloroflexi bacterium]|nr:DUF5667 domain-containing protein [Chloroflexota bacterium]